MSDETLKIGDYELEKPLTTNDSGFSKWGLGLKNGTRYFIKEFLSPVYPADDCGLSEKLIASRRKSCADFYRKKLELYNRLAHCQTGNIIWVEQFFRHGPRYYVATEYIDGMRDPVEAVKSATERQKRIILRLLAYNIAALHQVGIIHADLKPNNVMIKRTATGDLTAKLIDFDASFVITDPPLASEDVHGDLVYLAPEVFIRMRDECGDLTEQLDIFSLGVLFHELWCGTVPAYDHSRFHYPFEAAVQGEPFALSGQIPPDIQQVIMRMLAPVPEDRPRAIECFLALGGTLPGAAPPPSGAHRPSGAHQSGAGTAAPPPAGGSLRRAGNL